jgi:hypothetical protein
MVLASFGTLLFWCGVKDEDPRTVIASVFTGAPTSSGSSGSSGPAAPSRTAAAAHLGGVIPDTIPDSVRASASDTPLLRKGAQ